MTARRPPLAVLLAAAAWLGAALLTAAVVAPAAFAVLPTRTLAGALVGRVLPVLFVTGVALGALLAWRGGRTLARAMGLLAVIACGIAQFVIDPRIEAIRRSVGGPMDALAAGDPRRAAFGQLHGLSVLALGGAMLAVTVALAFGALSHTSENRT